MIVGRDDTYLTVEEFATMVGREPKTIRNWASEGRLRFADLCGVPLVSLRMVENLIARHVPAGAEDGVAALRAMNRVDRRERRAAPERRRSASRRPEVGLANEM